MKTYHVTRGKQYMSCTTKQELVIEQKLSELAELLDNQYNVKEFNIVLSNAIERHIELIDEQR